MSVDSHSLRCIKYLQSLWAEANFMGQSTETSATEENDWLMDWLTGVWFYLVTSGPIQYKDVILLHVV